RAAQQRHRPGPAPGADGPGHEARGGSRAPGLPGRAHAEETLRQRLLAPGRPGALTALFLFTARRAAPGFFLPEHFMTDPIEQPNDVPPEHRRAIKSFVMRAGRMTTGQQRGLE